MEEIKLCKFYDNWCGGERNCDGCAHFKELQEYIKEQGEEKWKQADLKK